MIGLLDPLRGKKQSYPLPLHRFARVPNGAN